jgi:hypothetical protein
MLVVSEVDAATLELIETLRASGALGANYVPYVAACDLRRAS